jgi:tetratricopeptide (TPR) repeat protein
LRFRLAAVLLLLLAGCSTDRSAAYKKAFSAGERAQTAGRYDEAASDYLSASDVANVERDKEYARYLSALMHARAGDTKTAAEMLEPIARGDTPYAALAAYKLADLRISHGEEERGWKDLAEVPVRFQDHGVGRVALSRNVRHLRETQSDAAALAWLESINAKMGVTGAGEAGSYERARLLSEMGRTKEARDSFVHTAETWPYPRGSYFDDSFYAASVEDEKLGDVPRAIDDLERMLKEREVARLYGSYQRPKFSLGQYRIGVLYDTKMHDRAHAREALHKLYTDHTTSILRDVALWYEAKLYDDDGEKEKACDTRKTLVDNLIDSKLVPCAEEKCPGVKRDAKSKAPKACHFEDRDPKPDF